jgi:acyl-CoA synthetase (NDP forming)
MAKPDIKPNGEQLEVMSTPEKAVPKLVTKVAVGKANNNIIISFVFDLPGERPQLIERVILDEHLADEMGELVKGLKEVKNG